MRSRSPSTSARYRPLLVTLVCALLLSAAAGPAAAVAVVDSTSASDPTATTDRQPTTTGGMPALQSATAGATSDFRSTTVEASPTLQSTTGDVGTIEATRTLALRPDQRGVVSVSTTYALPSKLTSLEVTLPERATVVETDGFTRNGRTITWEEDAQSPTVTYRLAVNETRETSGPIAAPGDHTFADVGDWALFRLPRPNFQWRWSGGGTITLEQAVTVSGPGAVGTSMAYLGPHEEVQRTANGQTFRLVVPETASLNADREAILDSMAAASRDLTVGPRDERVLMIAAPTDRLEWAVRGLQLGPSDFWVRDVASLETATNSWIHEYVHTRQDYTASTDAQWVTEATASYYAAQLTLEQGLTDFTTLRERLALGQRNGDRSAILARPSTWNGIAPYTKGALVAADLDRRIRTATDGRHSLQTVFTRLNDHPENIDAALFETTVREVAGDDAAAAARRFTTTEQAPSLWDRDTHEAVFGDLPARIDRTVAAYRAEGPYRNGTVTWPARLATGERLAVDVTARNVGGVAGETSVALFVDDQQRDAATVTVQPEASREIRLETRFDQPGTYTVTVAGEKREVTVEPPATPSVTALDVAREQLNGTTSVQVTATVENDVSIPAATNLTLAVDGEGVQTRRVRLGTHSETTVTFDAVELAAGSHVLRVGDRTETIEVGSEIGTGIGPGFGGGAVVVAVALLVVWSRRRGR